MYAFHMCLTGSGTATSRGVCTPGKSFKLKFISFTLKSLNEVKQLKLIKINWKHTLNDIKCLTKKKSVLWDLPLRQQYQLEILQVEGWRCSCGSSESRGPAIDPCALALPRSWPHETFRTKGKIEFLFEINSKSKWKPFHSFPFLSIPCGLRAPPRPRAPCPRIHATSRAPLCRMEPGRSIRKISIKS